MAWVYILESASARFYVGSTTDLDRRLEEHRRGHTHTAKRLGGELKIAAALEMPTLEEARTLERGLERIRLSIFSCGTIGWARPNRRRCGSFAVRYS
jgi:putative endonuclease